jgi:hypothetical protein
MDADSQEHFRCGDCNKVFAKRMDYKYTSLENLAEQETDVYFPVDTESVTTSHIHAHSAKGDLASKRTLTVIDRLTGIGNLHGTSDANFQDANLAERLARTICGNTCKRSTKIVNAGLLKNRFGNITKSLQGKGRTCMMSKA